MTLSFFQYNDKEVREILSTLVMIVDTREQKNSHIIEYFVKKNIPYKGQKLDVGDYSCYIPKNEKMGILRDWYIPVAIERKNSIDELAQSIKERTSFENELIRSMNLFKFNLLIEDPNGYENIVRGKYRSQYNPKSLLASLKTFESRYNFTTVFLPKSLTGNYIFYNMYYHARALIKNFFNKIY